MNSWTLYFAESPRYAALHFSIVELNDCGRYCNITAVEKYEIVNDSQVDI
jgi:hypothetical protein